MSDSQKPVHERIGAVAIGRNEGERLRACLTSLLQRLRCVVYVDSGSTDGSLELARELGVETVSLDMSIPFTAARARNAGFARLKALMPAVEFVHFVDGDCEVVPSWIDAAAALLDERPEVVVVCGLRRERHPDATPYNRLTQMTDWERAAGETKACGGDAIMRCAALDAVGGFDPTLIAGEEPELCFRLRREGGRIWRLDAEMTLHDAAIARFSQWWKRAVRAGHAFAEGAWRHGRSAERYNVQPTLSALAWGAGAWLAAVALAWPTGGWSLLLLLAYPLQAWRLALQQRERGQAWPDAEAYGAFVLIAKVAQAWGAAKFAGNLLCRRRTKLIEYK